MLGPEGRLAFICADRWMHNQYGERLRALVASEYAVDTVVAMHDVDAFEDTVSAYPAITVLRNGRQGRAHVVEAMDGFDAADGRAVAQWLADGRNVAADEGCYSAARLDRWFAGSGLWPSGSPIRLELLADLEERFDPLEDWRTGTRVGIGVATGCDDVFVVEDAPDVERCRLLPILTAQDIASGTPRWSGRFLVNPWGGGRLVDLDQYPGLASYLQRHSTRIRARHVARKRPASWYRTIDRVDPGLQARPKLRLPSLKHSKTETATQPRRSTESAGPTFSAPRPSPHRRNAPGRRGYPRPDQPSSHTLPFVGRHDGDRRRCERKSARSAVAAPTGHKQQQDNR